MLHTFAGSIDYTSLKHSIIPLMMSLCLNTPYLAVSLYRTCGMSIALEISFTTSVGGDFVSKLFSCVSTLHLLSVILISGLHGDSLVN